MRFTFITTCTTWAPRADDGIVIKASQILMGNEGKGLNNFFIGTLGNTGTTRLEVQMQESHWPDGDDNLLGSGDFSFDSVAPPSALHLSAY